MKIFFKAIALSSLTLASLHAGSSYIYGDFHTMGGYPMVGGGLRLKEGSHSLDFSANVCPVNLPDSLNVFHLRGLYCTHPGLLGIYFGGGVGLLNDPETIGLTASFENTAGLQWRGIFLEITSSIPFKDKKNVVPGLSCGIGF